MKTDGVAPAGGVAEKMFGNSGKFFGFLRSLVRFPGKSPAHQSRFDILSYPGVGNDCYHGFVGW